MSLLRWLVWGLVLLMLAGCRSEPPLSAGEVLAVDDPRANGALELHLERARQSQALRGTARVAVQGPGFKLNRPQRIALSRPNRLRFEIIGLFDQLAALLVSDGRRFGFYDASTGEITRGGVTSALLWELTRLDLDPEEAVGVLLGAPEPTPGLARSAAWIEPDGRLAISFGWPREGSLRAPECEADPARSWTDPACYLEEDALEGGGEIFLFDAGGRLAEVRAIDAGLDLRYRARFEDYEALEGREPALEFPKRIEVVSPAIEAEARFSWKRVMLEETLSDRLFRIPDRPRAAGPGG